MLVFCNFILLILLISNKYEVANSAALKNISDSRILSSSNIKDWSVTSKKEKVYVQLTKEPEGYKVSINLDKDCKMKDLYNYFDVDQVSFFKQNGIGPDEIIVQLEGNTLQTKIALIEDPARCENYYAIFQNPISGNYRLKIFRLRSNFAAILELNDHPDPLYDLFLDESIIGTLERYTPEPCDESIQGYWTSENDRLVKKTIKVRQKCEKSKNGQQRYRGLPITTNVIISDDVNTEHCANDIDKFLWNDKICKSGYNPDKDSKGEKLYENVRRKDKSPFVGQRILFIGDSHMRGLVQMFIYSYCEWDPDSLQDKHPDADIPKDDWDIEQMVITKIFWLVLN